MTAMTKAPAVDNLEKWLAQLSLEYLKCRKSGHRWEDDSFEWVPAERAHYVVEVCERCLAEKSSWWSVDGAVTPSGYQYPDGYLAGPQIGFITADGRNVMRLEYLSRIKERVRTRSVAS